MQYYAPTAGLQIPELSWFPVLLPLKLRRMFTMIWRRRWTRWKRRSKFHPVPWAATLNVKLIASGQVIIMTMIMIINGVSEAKNEGNCNKKQ